MIANPSKWETIDVGSCFGKSVGYTLSSEERTELGIDEGDTRPMSILGIGPDGLAMVVGNDEAALVAAAPELLQACKIAAKLLNDFPGTQKMLEQAIAKAEGQQ